MTIGVLREPYPETRVSIMPEHLSTLKKWNVAVMVEQNAGSASFASDENYLEQGASVEGRNWILEAADVVLAINAISPADTNQLGAGILLGFYQPLYNQPFVEDCVAKKLTVFSIDMIPRTTRAQGMDVLSSQANISGYKAVLEAANLFPRYFPMLMTAAGTIPPAKMLVLGAGIAGLQAIATGRRLGAVVEVFDTRPAVKEEVMSLGAKFIEVEGAADASKAGGYAVVQSGEFMQKQQAKIAERVAKADIIICTAQVPGRKAPVLVTTGMVAAMKSGSVIIDLAAATGGNTELTVNGQMIIYQGVRIVGNSNLPSGMPADASKLYGRNILNFLQLLVGKEGALTLDFDDELVKGTCIVHKGDIIHQRVIDSVSSPTLAADQGTSTVA